MIWWRPELAGAAMQQGDACLRSAVMLAERRSVLNVCGLR